MENYIYEIFKANKEYEMEHEFEKECPQIKAKFCVYPDQRSMRITLVQRSNFNYLGSFIATDFDCVMEDEIPLEFGKLPKGDKIANPDAVRKWYLKYMNKNFTTYKEDYLNHITKQANEDLGI